MKICHSLYDQAVAIDNGTGKGGKGKRKKGPNGTRHPCPRKKREGKGRGEDKAASNVFRPHCAYSRVSGRRGKKEGRGEKGKLSQQQGD